MICFVGAHYLIILRNPDLLQNKYSRDKWRLYNDTQIKNFRDWSQVTKYCIESKCLPTVLLYENFDYLDPRMNFMVDSLKLAKHDIQELEQLANE